jgi:hypothetical protein
MMRIELNRQATGYGRHPRSAYASGESARGDRRDHDRGMPRDSRGDLHVDR